MYTVLRNNRNLLLTFAFAGVLVYIGFMTFQLHRALSHILSNSSIIDTAGWLIAGGASTALIVRVLRTKGVLMGFSIYLCFLFIIGDGLMLGLKLFAAQTLAYAAFQGMYMGGVLPIVMAAAITLYGYINAKRIRAIGYELYLKKSFQPMRIAMISDMHLGCGFSHREMRKVSRIMEKVKPDVIMMGGDILEEKSRMEQFEQLLWECRKWNAPMGIYYVPGNHEYAGQQLGRYTIKQIADGFAKNGVTTLLDEKINLGGNVLLVGRNDSASKQRKQLSDILQPSDLGKAVLMLDHKPVGLGNAQQAGVDLQLSGHTHAGQMMPAGKLGEMCGHSEISYGYRNYGRYNALVTSGVGTWGFPIRVGSPSEVAVVDIKPSA